MFELKLILHFCFVLSVSAQCRSADHQAIVDLCYIFPTHPLNFQAARDFCHGLFSNLAVIHGTSQNSFLSTITRTKTGSTGNFWIGLSRSTVGSPYQWDDGTGLNWTNFDSNFPQNQLCVAESTVNAKWQSLNCQNSLSFVCSYDPRATVPFTSAPTTSIFAETSTVAPKTEVTCLMMFDTQSSGFSAEAVATYQTYFDFAKKIGNKLADVALFTGFIDNFGYGAIEDHQNYATLNIDDFNSIVMPVDAFDDDIDLDLKVVDTSLSNAVWVPPVKDQTCMVFISAASGDGFGGTTIKQSYSSFGTVVGALVGGATSIPGLTNVIAAPTLSDEDAQAVVDLILENLPATTRN